MKKARLPLVVGNWKMNPPLPSAAKRLFADVKRRSARIDGVEIVAAPPFVYLGLLGGGKSKAVALAAQDVYWEKDGAHTGEVSLPMLTHLGVTHIIIGHSERRAEGETDEMVNKKVAVSLKEGITAIVCVGEKKRDAHGDYFSFVEKQVREALKGVPKAKLGNVVIAYEPIWAIGTGNTATTEDAHEMKLYIQKTLTSLYGRNYAQKVRILYGGSVNAKNAAALMESTVDGFLVGGASLRADDFIEIIRSARDHDA